MSRRVREKYGLPVIVGSPQATALDAGFFISSKCDAVVRYEGELTVLELMNFYLEGVGALEKILGVSYFSGGEIRKNPERPLIKNLDALPFIDEDCYLEPKKFYRGFSLMTGRGCPFRCAFCHEGAHTKIVRLRSVENVLAEIDAFLEKWDSDDELYILFNGAHSGNFGTNAGNAGDVAGADGAGIELVSGGARRNILRRVVRGIEAPGNFICVLRNAPAR